MIGRTEWDCSMCKNMRRDPEKLLENVIWDSRIPNPESLIPKSKVGFGICESRIPNPEIVFGNRESRILVAKRSPDCH